MGSGGWQQSEVGRLQLGNIGADWTSMQGGCKWIGAQREDPRIVRLTDDARQHERDW